MQIKKTPTTRGAAGDKRLSDFTRHLHLEAIGIETIATLARSMSGTAGFRDCHEIGTGSATLAPGAKNTKEHAVATFAEKKVFSRPEFMGLGLGVVNPQGHQHGVFHVLTPSPIRQSKKLVNGCKSQHGANQMAHANSTPTPSMQGNTTHDQNQTDLFFQASNHLSQALYQLRNATGDQGIKTAAGRANAAARALNRLATAVSTKRKQVELVPVTDPRLAQHYPETSGGLSAEPDGPWLLAIGRKCTDQQLERFAQREGFSVAELVAFRDGLSESGVKA